MRGAKPRKSLNPLVLLDYRCYVDGGKIGVNYPPRVTQCLSKLSRMSPQQVVTEYGFPDEHAALMLQKRASGEQSRAEQARRPTQRAQCRCSCACRVWRG